MPQSLCQIYLHIVFSTKNREPFLRDEKHRKAIHSYLCGICENLDCPALKVGGVEDHVHILCRFSRGIEVKDLLAELKRDSSKRAKALDPSLSGFYWQAGYGAFSISPSHVLQLSKYIESQVEHHKKESFRGRTSAYPGSADKPSATPTACGQPWALNV